MNKGIILVLLGYIGWGLFPLYWGLLTHVSAMEVLTHRMLWSVPVLLIFVSIIASWRTDFFHAIKSKKELAFLGHGGLCKDCPECSFPHCPFGKGI